MPRPGSQVIPNGWSEHHRPVAVGSMTARCLIDRDGTGEDVYDPETGTTTPPARVVVYPDLPCRVQQLRQPQTSENAGQQVTAHDYLVPVPITATAVLMDDQVLITANPDDPSLVGHRFTITDILRGSLQWERDLGCIDNLG